MRHINERGIEIVKSFEGFSSEPYLCPAKVWTIGYGSTTGSDGGPVDPDMEPVTDADALLGRDLEASERWVTRLVKTPLSENQFSALTSFTFNVGCGALQRSTLRMKLNRGEYLGAADEFPKWRRAGAEYSLGWLGEGRRKDPYF